MQRRPRKGLQWKARSAVRTCNGKPDPQGYAQHKKLKKQCTFCLKTFKAKNSFVMEKLYK